MRDRKASDARYVQQPHVKLWRRIYYRYYMRAYRKGIKAGIPMDLARVVAKDEATKAVKEMRANAGS